MTKFLSTSKPQAALTVMLIVLTTLLAACGDSTATTAPATTERPVPRPLPPPGLPPLPLAQLLLPQQVRLPPLPLPVAQPSKLTSLPRKGRTMTSLTTLT